MDHGIFVGMGPGPDGVDLPMGLGMQLAQEPQAMEAFGSLSAEQKRNLVQYVQSCATGGEAKDKIRDAVSRLKDNDISIFM